MIMFEDIRVCVGMTTVKVSEYVVRNRVAKLFELCVK